MLAGCAAFVCLAVGALFVLNVAYERNTAIEVARRDGSNLAQSLARQAADAFEATDCALLGLAERVQVERQGGTRAIDSAGRERLEKWMAMQVMMVPRMHELVVVDESGRSERSDGTVVSSPLYVPEVTYLRAHPEATSVVTGKNTNGKSGWTILMSRRVDRADGSFGGAVIALIAVDYFDRIYKSVDVGRSGTIALISDDGTVLARDPPASSDRRRLDMPIVANPLKPETGYVTNRDGVRRLLSYRRLDHYPLAIVVGLAESEYLAGWHAAAIVNSIAFAVVLATIVALAAGLRLQMRRRSTAEGRLAELALLDGLTGLANRRHFDAVLEREWSRAKDDGSPLALLMIDVDNFKAYNDRYGHVGGDTALITIARALATSLLRKGDLAARYGGEEFAVILPSTDTENAVAIGERIRAAVVALDIPHADASGFIVTVSVGVAALAPSPTARLPVLVQTADNALYDAKRGGRNRTAVMPDGSELRALTLR